MAGPLWPTLLAEAWSALSGESGDAGEVRLPAGLEVLWVSGAPGGLPSRLPAEDVAIACAGAALLAAAALHAQRGGDSGSRGSPVVRLDRGHVAAAFRSEAFLRVDGQPAGPGFAPLSRFWRAADGWVRTHGNYPWHRAALLRALGCAGDVEGDPEPVAAAIAELGARQAEDLVTGAGGVAAAVRDEASWQAEPPGQAVAATALVEATSVGGAPPRWRPAGALPASGIRVLDLTRVIAGPVATRYLGALGADVLRLDPPDRPELTMQTYDGLLAKRSALLDFGVDGGHDRLHDLLSGADVLVHGYRPHALDRFGLDPQTLAERHPGLVVVSLSAWGSRGPWGGRRGFDSIVQAASGIALAESARRRAARRAAVPAARPRHRLPVRGRRPAGAGPAVRPGRHPVPRAFPGPDRALAARPAPGDTAPGDGRGPRSPGDDDEQSVADQGGQRGRAGDHRAAARPARR